MKKFLFLFVATASLASCSSDEPMIKQEENQVNNLYPYKEIIERANYYYSQLPGKTRATTPSVGNIELIGYNSTRSENETPTYCLVNYENEAAFVI